MAEVHTAPKLLEIDMLKIALSQLQPEAPVRVLRGGSMLLRLAALFATLSTIW
jgi:hypothetical protein